MTVHPEPAAPIMPARPVGVFDHNRRDGTDGYEYVRFWECGRLLNIAETAFREARNQISKAEEAGSEEECRELAEDALKCASTAEHYTRMLLAAGPSSSRPVGPEASVLAERPPQGPL